MTKIIISTLYDKEPTLVAATKLGADQLYIVVDDPTSQRLAGLLKEDGYQYPCCLVDGDKLLIGYSVNKEDIECGIIDTTRI